MESAMRYVATDILDDPFLCANMTTIFKLVLGKVDLWDGRLV